MDRDLVEFVVIDQLVPKAHLLRKIDAAVDFTQLYEMVEPLYCEDNGRPSIDPVVLFKMVLVQHLYGLTSLRRTAEEVSANNCYRWFLGYPLQEETPHFSTVSYNFRHRFTDDDNDPPASPRKHKDNTSKKKLARRKKQGFRTVTKSVTDPDCGLFVKGGHKRQFAYEAHTACDKNGFVLETVVTPGNVHDSVAFDEVYDKITENFPQVEAVVADAAYKTPHICKKVFGDGRVLSTAYKRPQTMKNGHEWWKYVYDEFYNCVICPEYQPLKYSTTNRDGYREYKSDPNICAACPTRERCTHSRDCIKTVQRHIWKDYEELADDARYTPVYAQLYKCRKETIERVFADAKEKHAMRYTQYRGLAQVTNWVKLKFAAMNLKKLATWKWRNLLSSFRFAVFSLIYVRDPVCS
ncbi:MAG: transposase [Oscillibacter sp.]